MPVISTDNWTPTVASPTRIKQIGAGVSGRASVQITNNTAWALLVNDSAVPPAAAGDAKYVLPARATGRFPLGSWSCAVRWTGQVAGSGDLVSLVYSDDQVAPEVIPGVNAQGYDSTTGYAQSTADTGIVNLSAGGGSVTPTAGFFVVGAIVENPTPYWIEVRRTNSAGATVATLPPFTMQALNVGAASVYVGPVVATVNGGGATGSYYATTAMVVTVRMFSAAVSMGAPARVFDPMTPAMPSTAGVQVQGINAIPSNVVGTTVDLMTLPAGPNGSMYAIRDIHITQTLVNNVAGTCYSQLDILVANGLSGATTNKSLGTMMTATATALGSYGATDIRIKGPIYVAAPAGADNKLKVNTLLISGTFVVKHCTGSASIVRLPSL